MEQSPYWEANRFQLFNKFPASMFTNSDKLYSTIFSEDP